MKIQEIPWFQKNLIWVPVLNSISLSLILLESIYQEIITKIPINWLKNSLALILIILKKMPITRWFLNLNILLSNHPVQKEWPIICLDPMRVKVINKSSVWYNRWLMNIKNHFFNQIITKTFPKKLNNKVKDQIIAIPTQITSGMFISNNVKHRNHRKRSIFCCEFMVTTTKIKYLWFHDLQL